MDTKEGNVSKTEDSVDYPKASSGGTESTMFQVKINTLLLVHGVMFNKSFKLATEMCQKQAGKFDDAVYQNGNKSMLLQAKHTSSEQDKKIITSGKMFSTVDNDFMIAKYLHSYLDNIKHNHKLDNVEKLVLFTNWGINIASFNIAKTNSNYLTEAENILPNINELDGKNKFYKFTKESHQQLNALVVSHHCNVVARKVVSNVLDKKNVKLSWQYNDFNAIASFLLSNTFEMDKDNDGAYRVMRVKPSGNKNGYIQVFEKNILDELQKKSNANLEDLNTILERTVIYVEGHTEMKEMVSVKDNDVKEFCKLFVLAVNQPNVDRLDPIIDSVVSEYGLFRGLPVDSIVKSLICCVEKWSNDKTGKYLDQKSGTQIFQNIYIQQKSVKCVLSSNSLDVLYKEEHLVEMRELLKTIHNTAQTSSHNVTLMSSSCGTGLLITKIYQALKDDQYVYLELGDLGLNEIQDVIRESNIVTGCVINCMTPQNTEQYYNCFQMTSNKKVHLIFVTSHDGCVDDLERVLEEIFDTASIDVTQNHINFNELTEESQNVLLSNKIINFQGDMRSLNDIVNVPVSNIEGDVLCELTGKTAVLIGQVPQCVWELSEAYMATSQNVNIQRLIQLMTTESDLVFAISGVEDINQHKNMKMKETEKRFLSLLNNNEIIKNKMRFANNVKSDGNVIIFGGESDKFQSICKNTNRLVYWIVIKDDSLILRRVFNPFFYIKRQLRHVVSVEIDITIMSLFLDSYKDVTCIISGVRGDCYDKLTQMLNKKSVDNKRIVLLKNTNDECILYRDACKQFPTVHWLHVEGEKMIWKQSHGSLDLIRNSQQRVRTYEEDEFVCDMDKSLVILSGDAGMGKSSALTKMCHVLRESNKLVIRINFKDTGVRLGLESLSKRRVSTENIVNFICNIRHLRLCSSMAKYLLEYYLDGKFAGVHKLFFILDGWDEVPSHVRKTAGDFLDYLVENGHCIVYLATRPHCAFDLENRYSILSTKFQDIPEDFQQKFLTDYWFHVLLIESEYFNKNKVQDMAHKILVTMTDIFQGMVEFTGTPLYLRFIADLHLKYLRGEMENLFESDFDTFSIYKEIIQVKYDIYFKEKKPHITVASDEYKMIKKILDECHSSIAFSKLFPDLSSQVTTEFHKDIADYHNDLMLAGILHSAPTDGGPGEYDFIHRTFTEYYGALYLVNCLKQGKDSNQYKLVKNHIAKEHLFLNKREDPYEMLKLFVVSLLVKELPLHRGVFKKDTKCFNQDTNIPDRDCLGRTPLHYAVMYGDEYIIHKFWNIKWLTPDDLGRTPFHYCCRYRDKNIILYLLSLCTELNHDGSEGKMRRIKCEMLNERDVCGHSVLDYAIHDDDGKLIDFLFHYNIDISKSSRRDIYSLYSKYWFTLPNTLGVPSLDILWKYNIDITLFKICDGSRIIEELNKWSPSARDGNGEILSKIFNKILDLQLYDEVVETWTDNNHLKFQQYKLDTIDRKINKTIYDVGILRVVLRCNHLNTFKYLINHQRVDFNLSETAMAAMKQLISSNKLNLFYMELIYLIILYDADEYFKHCQSIDMSCNRALTLAVRYGKLSLVSHMLNSVDIASRDEVGRSLLHTAAMAGRVDIIKCVLSGRDDVCDIVNVLDKNNRSALDYCVETKREDDLYIFYDDWMRCEDDREVFCHVKESIFCIKYLLECGAKFHHYEHLNSDITSIVNATSKTVNSMYDKAIQMKCDLLIVYLLLLGADLKDMNPLTLQEFYSIYQNDVNIRDIVRRVPLHDVARTGDDNFLLTYIHKKRKVLYHWIRKENDALCYMAVLHKLRDLSIKDNNGDTPLHIAARYGHTKVIETLLGHGAEYDTVNNNDETPAQCWKENKNSPFDGVSNRFKNIEQEHLKLKYRKNKYYIGMQDKCGRTSQHWAAKNGFLKTFTDHVNLNTLDHYQRTPLHYAVETKAIDIVRKLLTLGAVYDHKDSNGKRPADLCEDETIRLYLDLIKQMFESVKANRVKETLAIIRDIESREDRKDVMWCVVNARDSVAGNTLLHYAVYRGQLDIVYFILSSGGMYNVRNFFDFEPIHYSSNVNINKLFRIIHETHSKYNDLSILEYCDFDVNTRKCLSNARDWRYGNTLLHTFSKSFYPCCVKWLLKYATRQCINAPNFAGETPLRVAADNERLLNIKLLCEFGANIDNISSHHSDEDLVEYRTIICKGLNLDYSIR